MENIYKHSSPGSEMKLSTMRIENLRLRAYIGFKEWETRKLQDIVISYSFRYNVAKAIQSDAESDAVDYKKINKAIIRLIDQQRYNLLETVAEKVHRTIKKNCYTREVWVRVEKPHALRFTDNVMAEVSDQDRLNETIIGLGSNINPEENMEQALARIKTLGLIVRQTDFIYTPPERKQDQPDFLNGALLMTTPEYYEDLYDKLKHIEDLLGRDRTGDKNGPRVIDLDIVTFNEAITDEEVFEYDFLEKFVRELKPDLVLEKPEEI